MSEDDEAFMRSVVVPEEDLAKYRPSWPWRGEFRWFRSPNIVCLEHYRRQNSNGPTRTVGRSNG